MTDGIQKLEQDLTVLAAMAEQMDAYLQNDILFGKMEQGGMPMLTLGGYLLRQHRLLALSELLSEAEQRRLETAVIQFNTALVEKIVRFESKAETEVAARIRQFAAYLHDLGRGQATGMNYGTAVEPRAMIAALRDKLQMKPYHLDPQIPRRVETLDNNLRQHWVTGEFIWPEAWQPAYPPDEFWWLYGKPN